MSVAQICLYADTGIPFLLWQKSFQTEHYPEEYQPLTWKEGYRILWQEQDKRQNHIEIPDHCEELSHPWLLPLPFLEFEVREYYRLAGTCDKRQSSTT